MLVGDDGTVPKERYVSRAFLDLEMERLWPRVWQVACREEELADVGDYVDYVIGDQSILVVRAAPDTIKAYFNTCLHRGTRLGEGCGPFAGGTIRCRYHGWCYDLDGRVTTIPDAHEFDPVPSDLRLGEVRAERWQLRPRPRLGLAEGEFDEWEILAGLVAGLGGAFLKEERDLVEELRAASLPPGTNLLERYQERRMELLQSRGFDVSGLAKEQ